MRKICILAILAAASVAMAGYTETFEDTDITALTDLGWTFSPWGDPAQFVAIETGTVHSGAQALRLPRATRALFPVDDFGTLSMWVYDAGVTMPDTDEGHYYGQNWGLAKDANWIGGSISHHKWLHSSVAYSASLGNSGDTVGDSLFSPTWMDAGVSSDNRSRGQAGWMHWEITYHEPGKIQVDLLEDPNGCAARRHAGPLGSAPDGIGDAPSGSTFAADALGGATHIYLRGCSYAGATAADSLFGDLIVDDIVWTPKSEQRKPGDANGDGHVNIEDFVILKQNYNATSGKTFDEGDFNGDGAVNIEDFVILKQNYNT